MYREKMGKYWWTGEKVDPAEVTKVVGPRLWVVECEGV